MVIVVVNVGLDPEWARPEWLLITVFAVPPPAIRPAVAMGGNMRCEDDLTHQIMTILKANIKLKDCIDQGQPRDIIERLEIYLQV